VPASGEHARITQDHRSLKMNFYFYFDKPLSNRIFFHYVMVNNQSGVAMPKDIPFSVTDDEAEPRYLKLAVRLTDGTRFEPQAASGFRLMELMRAYGLPIKAECGGACVCATCHVRVPVAWRHLLPPPSAEELAKLDEIADADDSSRLACQLMMTDALDGLEVELQPDSLIPQTNWVAG
jgi:ferredoxin, 2Fe-2S